MEKKKKERENCKQELGWLIQSSVLFPLSRRYLPNKSTGPWWLWGQYLLLAISVVLQKDEEALAAALGSTARGSMVGCKNDGLGDTNRRYSRQLLTVPK